MGSAEMNPFLDSVCRRLRLLRPPSPSTVDFLSRTRSIEAFSLLGATRT